MRKFNSNQKINAIFVFIFALTSILQACFVMPNHYTKVAPGIWRAVLQLTPSQITPNKKGAYLAEKLNLKFEEATTGELPFLLDIEYANDTTVTVTIVNGEEKIKSDVEDIKIGHSKATGKDTIRIDFPVYGSYIRAVYRERVMEGEWVFPVKKLSIPFIAHQGDDHRFTTLSKTPVKDITGKWATVFYSNDSSSYNAIGEFVQKGNILNGTFRTETGDYRFLSGEVQGDKIYLSCFDGAHAFLFEGKIEEAGTIVGSFRSGRSDPEYWEAKHDDNFKLKDANSISGSKVGNTPINFIFSDAEGKKISLKDYGNKVKIIQIMGTWCPNCRDETNFLTNYLKNNKNDKLSVIALAFERNKDVAQIQVETYKKKMNVPYDILIAGTTTNKDSTAKALPFLTDMVGYPTMIFLDKNNIIRRVHTGFDGPATSEYPAFEKEFDAFTQKLLKE